jgi:site-specific recombinase XerD
MLIFAVLFKSTMAKKARKIKQIVKLRAKPLQDGNSHLYLDTYQNGTRQYEFLRLFIVDKPSSPIEREKNNEIMRLAEDIRTKRESELKHREYGFISPHKKKVNFLDYCDKFVDSYPNKDIRIVRYGVSHFKDFVMVKYLAPAEITEDLLRRYKAYMEQKLNGETPHNYFAKFKRILNQARKDGLISTDPAEGIRNTKNDGLKKDILSFDEIQLLAKTPCGNQHVKNAFLFCLNTGLRHCDVIKIKWSQITDGRLIIKSQSKTDHPVYIDLNKNAQAILHSLDAKIDSVFQLPSLEACLKDVRNWVKRAEIKKRITWHSARHTFAVNLLITGGDIKTVSSLLGHSSLKHTEKYTRIVDEMKRKAVDNLPEIVFSK